MWLKQGAAQQYCFTGFFCLFSILFGSSNLEITSVRASVHPGSIPLHPIKSEAATADYFNQ